MFIPIRTGLVPLAAVLKSIPGRDGGGTYQHPCALGTDRLTDVLGVERILNVLEAHLEAIRLNEQQERERLEKVKAEKDDRDRTRAERLARLDSRRGHA